MEHIYYHERCELWWLQWHAAVKVGLSILAFCTLLCWLCAGVFIVDDYTEADMNRIAIDSLRNEINVQRLTAQRDALLNTMVALERMNVYLAVIDSTGQAKPIRRKR